MSLDTLYQQLNSNESMQLTINQKNLEVATTEGFLDEANPVSIVTHSFKYDIAAHKHDFFELIFVLEGEQTFSVDGKTVTLRKNQFCLLNRTAMHEIPYKNDDNKVFYIMIRPDFFSTIFFQLAFSVNHTTFYNFLFSDENRQTCNNYFICDANSETDPIALNLIQTIILEYVSENDTKEKMLNFLLSALLIDIARLYFKSLTTHTNQEFIHNNADEMETIIQAIYRNSKDITLKSLAQKFNYNEFYLSNLIKQYTNSTFTDILQMVRFKKICFDLINTDKPIQTIFFDNGYTNRSWVTKKFKDFFDMTPTQYRELNKP